jgi:hypothetical protein
MHAFSLQPEDVSADAIAGTILCTSVVAATDTGRIRLHKGQRLTAGDVPALRAAPYELHLLALDDDDLHEDEASLRLAHAVAGDGLDMHGPVESQTHLRAARRGMVSVDTVALEQMNLLPDVSVFTVFDGQPVDEGKSVGAAKVTPLAVPAAVVREAEAIARAAAPVIQVRPFLGEPVGVLVRERLTEGARGRFEAAIALKLGWFGSPVLPIHYLPEDVDAVVKAGQALVDAGVSLILAAGVNSTDPLDLTIQAMDRLGAVAERRGVPAHPGSTCWLAYVGNVPVFGLALCGMFSRTTVLDLLLPRFLSGRPVRATEIARLGHGGVLGKDMAFRFPPYQHETETA